MRNRVKGELAGSLDDVLGPRNPNGTLSQELVGSIGSGHGLFRSSCKIERPASTTRATLALSLQFDCDQKNDVLLRSDNVVSVLANRKRVPIVTLLVLLTYRLISNLVSSTPGITVVVGFLFTASPERLRGTQPRLGLERSNLNRPRIDPIQAYHGLLAYVTPVNILSWSRDQWTVLARVPIHDGKTTRDHTG